MKIWLYTVFVALASVPYFGTIKNHDVFLESGNLDLHNERYLAQMGGELADFIAGLRPLSPPPLFPLSPPPPSPHPFPSPPPFPPVRASTHLHLLNLHPFAHPPLPCVHP